LFTTWNINNPPPGPLPRGGKILRINYYCFENTFMVFLLVVILRNLIMSRDIIPYNPDLREIAKKLRKNPTASENILWKELKGRKVKGLDFDRQKPIDNFIVDFYCKDLKLAIEVDGSSHIGKEVWDLERQTVLESFGISFLRFSDIKVIYNLEEVIKAIELWVEENLGS
jgi:very-short-patch-repair endonuclease